MCRLVLCYVLRALGGKRYGHGHRHDTLRWGVSGESLRRLQAILGDGLLRRLSPVRFGVGGRRDAMVRSAINKTCNARYRVAWKALLSRGVACGTQARHKSGKEFSVLQVL